MEVCFEQGVIRNYNDCKFWCFCCTSISDLPSIQIYLYIEKTNFTASRIWTKYVYLMKDNQLRLKASVV